MGSKQTSLAARARARLREFAPALWPVGAKIVLHDVLASVANKDVKHVPTETVLQEVIAWIKRAQDSSHSGGIPAYFSVYGGYGPDYPETTGYLITTLLDYADYAHDNDSHARAVKAADWLVSLQFPEGAFPGGFARSNDGPSVFNTGQILNGLVAFIQRHDDHSITMSARRTGDWLCNSQDSDGAWRRFTYEHASHVYYTMVAWSLALLARETGDDRYRQAALRNCLWAISQQEESGWLNGFNLGDRPIFLHFIAYALQGLLEVGILCHREEFVMAAKKGADALRARFNEHGKLAGAYSQGWRENAGYACVTGNSQTSIVWQRLAQHTGDISFRDNAVRLNELVKSSILLAGHPGFRGGVKGSNPIWGKYQSFRFPNWAAKFTADALMLEAGALSYPAIGTIQIEKDKG